MIFCDFTDFNWFQPNFINFQVFKAIQHVKHILTRKIVQIYELNLDFNNIGSYTSLRFFFQKVLTILRHNNMMMS